MHRKRKFNELLNKGVFKNDKKSCMIDLKPLDQKLNQHEKPREKRNDINNNQMEIRQYEEIIKMNQNNKKVDAKDFKVGKNLGFGSFFKNLREEIVEVFLAKDDLISFEGLFNSAYINDLFNFPQNRDSKNKPFINKGNNVITTESYHGPNSSIDEEKQKGLMNYLTRVNVGNKILEKNSTFNRSTTEEAIEEGEEIVLYEDENETIIKRRKSKTHIPIHHQQQPFYPEEEFKHSIEENPFLGQGRKMINKKCFPLASQFPLSESRENIFNNHFQPNNNLPIPKKPYFSKLNLMNSYNYNENSQNNSGKNNLLLYEYLNN
jgi:hypothetical protein